LERGIGVRGFLSCAATESSLLCRGDDPDMRRPGEDVPIVRQDIVLGLRAGCPVLRVEQVEGDVAADNPLASERRRSFH
jgi:hypothetical protein